MKETAPGGNTAFDEIGLMAPARAYRAVSFIRELARVVCIFGSPLVAWMFVHDFLPDLQGGGKLWAWLAGTVLCYLVSYLGLTFSALTMRPGLGVLFLAVVAGPSLWVIVPYVWNTKDAQSYALVFGAITVLALPFLWAGLQTARLGRAGREIARPSPPIRSFAGFLREVFAVWPGLKRSFWRRVAADVLTYSAALALWAGTTVLAALGFLVICLFPVFLHTHGIGEVTMQVLALLVLALLTGATQSLCRSGARWFSRASYADQVERDGRPPILFLRSFQDDQVRLPERGFLPRLWRAIFSPGIRGRRLDHFLIEGFSRYGPALALGNPGEKNLPFGAARVYCTHDTWKDKVAEIADRADHVLLVADSTPGVEWEIYHFLKPPWREKTLFIVAPKSADLREAPTLAAALRQEGVPDGGPPILACYWNDEGRLTVLRADMPRSPEAF
ncbi:MAG: hypothetical protein EOP87_21565, partial [Verrucomicrobiaceae bacterium]